MGYSQQSFSGLGGADSGGSGFKTISNIPQIVVSNIMVHDGSILYPNTPSGQNVATMVFKANGTDVGSFDVTDMMWGLWSGFNSTTLNPGTSITFKDATGTVIETWNSLAPPYTNSNSYTSNTTHSILSIFGKSSGVNGVAEIEININISGGAMNFEINSISAQNFQPPVLNNPPTASAVSFTGTLHVGQTLTGSYTYTDLDNDPEGATSFVWYRSDNASGLNRTAIGGATSQTYQLQSADLGKYISFQVTPHDGTVSGTPVESTRLGPVITTPTVTTAAASLIETTSVTLGGDVTADGGSAVTNRGIVYNTTGNPSILDNTTQIGLGSGSFSAVIENLSPATTYYVRAYAINAVGSSLGNEISFTTTSIPQTITFNEIGPKTYGDAPFILGPATTSEGLTVTFTAADPTIVSISGNEATILKAGSTTITATQAGSGGVAAATPVVRDLEVATVSLTVINAEAVSRAYNGTNVVAISGATLSGVVSGDDVTLTNAVSGTTGLMVFGDGLAVTTTMGLTGADAGNYSLTQPSLSVDISQRTLNLSDFTADHKTYDGTTDVSGDGFDDDRVGGDVLTFSYDVSFADANVGNGITVNYSNIAISGGVSAAYYDLASTTGSTTANITARAITVTADAADKVYGEDDPDLTYEITSGSLVTGEEFTGTLVRAAGENVDTYAITQGTLTAGDNYDLSFTGADFTITPKTLVVVADEDQSKTYGEADPTFTFTATGFEFSDDANVFTGTLSRTDGENVGNYAIQIGSLSASDNYTIDFNGTEFEITPRTLTVSADAGQQKLFGEEDPVFTFTAENFGWSDNTSILNGSLSREPGESAGFYNITSGDLSAGDNYEIDFIGSLFAITARPIVVAAIGNQSKVYGDEDPELIFTVSGISSQDLDGMFTGALDRLSGENVGTYTITIGNLTANDNFEVSFESAEFSITPAELSVKADENLWKFEGQDDPEFTYTISGFKFNDNESILTGALDRVAGEQRGMYTIQSGDLSAGENYSITFEPATFAIVLNPPVLLSSNPFDGEEMVAFDALISITFDKDIVLTDLAQSLIQISDGSQTLDYSSEVMDQTLTLSHEGLPAMTLVTVTIGNGAVQNLDGIVNEAFSFSFSTMRTTPEPVSLLSPENNSGSVSLITTVQWTESELADEYHIQVALNSNFDTPILDETVYSGTEYDLSGTINYATEYFWRVRAGNESGYSEWSMIHQFVTVATQPIVKFPLTGSVDISTAPTLEWDYDSFTDDMQFRVQIATDEDFESLLDDQLSTTTTRSFIGLNDNSDYYWRVRYETPRTTSEWTNPQSFRTRPAPSSNDHIPITENVTFGNTSTGGNAPPSPLDYRLLGIPGSDNFPLASFFNGNYLTDWRAFFENGAESNFYEEYNPDNPQFTFEPGLGYWVLSTSDLSFDLTITSVVNNERDAYSVPIHQGWNIVTNPHRVKVAVIDVNEINGREFIFYGYDQQFFVADTLRPFQAYYLYNSPDNVMSSIEIPYTGLDQRRSSDNTSSSIEQKSKDPAHSVIVSALYNSGYQAKVELVYPEFGSNNDDSISSDNSVRKSDSDTDSDLFKRYHPSLEKARMGMLILDNSTIRGGFSRLSTTFDLEESSHQIQLKGSVGETFSWTVEPKGMPDGTAVLLTNTITGKSWLLDGGVDATVTISEPISTFDVFVGHRNELLELQESMLPKEISLMQNYPNPFNPVTNIRYSIPQEQHVRLEVFDILGRQVMVLQDGVQPAGWHLMQFDASRLSSGVYLYRLSTSSTVKVQKMTLIK